MSYRVGDKFIIEIDSHMTNKNGDLYGIKGFNSLIFDEYGLGKLERYAGTIDANEIEEVRGHTDWWWLDEAD